MSQIRLVIRECDRDWSGIIDAASADRVMAALSADPMTLEEVEAAVARYAGPAANGGLFAHFSPRLCDEPHDAGIVIIDLVARLVVADSTYSSPAATGEVCYHDGRAATDKWFSYHLADDWLFARRVMDWRLVADERRSERAARPAIDLRAVLYGQPLLEFVARETLGAFVRHRAAPATVKDAGSRAMRPRTDDEVIYDLISSIHAAWQLTPRGELDGACPREATLRRREHLSWDLQDQCERWSLLGECPPGLDPSSFACRFGGMGTHEVVTYYDMVRTLLWSCWRRLAESAIALIDSDTSFVACEVARLERVRDEWLDTPDPEFHGRTPRSVIERERARLPEAMSSRDAMIDPDCPCCQMMADLPGPVFWHMDGCNMDDDFAFDLYHPTREAWEAERRRWEEDARRFNEKWEQRKRDGVAADDGWNVCGDSVWSTSFSEADDADTPLTLRLFGLGAHLTELVSNLRDGECAVPDAQRWIDRLNRDFGNLREVLQSAEPATAAALIDPVTTRFTDTLAALATERPDLEAKCESLSRKLAGLVDPASS